VLYQIKVTGYYYNGTTENNISLDHLFVVMVKYLNGRASFKIEELNNRNIL